MCKIKMILLGISFGLILGACSSKSNSGLALDEINKPAQYWYEHMLKEIKSGNLDKADSYFVSLQSEHLNSPLLKEAMLILGVAHMKEEEYQLAGFYFDEFTKRFGNAENIDFIKYMKLQSNYFAFAKQNRNQELLLDSIKEVRDYSEKYPYSRYLPIADTMLLKLELANLTMNKEIAKLYKRRNKVEAQNIYQEKIDNESWANDVHFDKAKTSWYERIFSW